MAKTITWKNDDNELCVLSIADGSSDETSFLPAADPFMTAIQESDDLFAPIRTSSGYLRIVVDSVDDIAALVGSSPLNRAVTLTTSNASGSSSTVKWKGFLSCESFTQTWDKGPIEIELPVISPLGVLQGIYPSDEINHLGYINFAQFLLNMNEELGLTFTDFFFPVLSEAATTLQYQFTMQNYATATEHNTGHEVASYYEILEDICKLFGWQAIEYGTYLVFLAADVKKIEAWNTNNYQGYTVQRMTEIANGGTSVTVSNRPSFTAVIPTIGGADHSQTWLAGKKSVEVTGDLNERSETIWSMDVFEQCEFKGNNYHQETTVGNRLERYTVKKMGCIDGGNIEVYNNVFSGGALLPDTDGNNIKYAMAYLGATNAIGASITYEQFAKYQNTLPYKTIIGGSLDFFQRLILKAYSSISIVNAKISTNFWYDPTQNSQYNAFRISADVKYATDAVNAFESSWSGQKYLEVSLVIENGSTEYYYDRSNNRWTTDGGKFNIYCSDGKIDEASYNSIPVPANITGEVIMYIWSSTDGIGDGFIALENLNIQLYTKEGRVKGKQSPRVELDELRENENVEKVDMNNGFTEAWSQDCGLTLARENVPDSYGVVLAADKTLPSALYDDQWPEDAMASRVANYYSRARQKLKVIVKQGASAGYKGALLSPMRAYQFVANGQSYICVEQQMNWKTNEITAGFFEPSFIN